MITQNIIAENAGLAGSGFTWSASKSARPHSDIRTGLKAWLYQYAQGLCVFCAMPVSEGRSQACHIVSSGGPKVRRGYLAGNIANGCGDCNDRHGESFDIVPLSEIARPDLVPIVWPSNVELRNLGRAIKATRLAA